MIQGKKSLSIVLAVCLLLSILGGTGVLLAMAEVTTESKYQVIYEGNDTDASFIDSESTNTYGAWSGYRTLENGKTITYKLDLPDNTVSVGEIGSWVAVAPYTLQISKDKTTWVDAPVSRGTMANSEGAYFTAEDQSFLDNNSNKIIYLRFTGGGSCAIGTCDITYTVSGEVSENSSSSESSVDSSSSESSVDSSETSGTDKKEVFLFNDKDGIDSDKSYIDTDGVTNSYADWNGYRTLENNASITYEVNLPDNIVSLDEISSWVAVPSYSIKISKDKTTWVDATTTEMNNSSESVFTPEDQSFLNSNDDNILYIQITGHSSCAYGNIILRFTVDTALPEGTTGGAVNNQAIQNKSLVVLSGYIKDTQELNDKTFIDYTCTADKYAVWSGYRTLEQGDTITYKLDLPDNTVSIAKIDSWVAVASYSLQVSKDKTTWVDATITAGEMKDMSTASFTPDDQTILENNNSKIIYLRFTGGNSCAIGNCEVKYTVDTMKPEENPVDMDVSETDVNVKVHIPAASIPLNVTEIRVGSEAIEGGSVYKEFKTYCDGKNMNFSMYNILLYNAQQEVLQLNGSATVSLPAPAGFTADGGHLYFYNVTDQKVEELTYTVENGNISFITASFGNFAFATEKVSNTSSTITSNKTEPSVESTGETPETGESAVVGGIILLLASMAAVVVRTSKKRS